MTVLVELSTSQQALLDSLVDPECVQYFTPAGLELHDVEATALLGEIASILYPYEEVDALVDAGMIRLIGAAEDPFTARPYYELAI